MKWRRFSSLSLGLTGTGTAPIRTHRETRPEEGGVVESEQHTLLASQTQLQKQIPSTVDLPAQLVIREGRVRRGNGDLFSTSLLHLALDDVAYVVALT